MTKSSTELKLADISKLQRYDTDAGRMQKHNQGNFVYYDDIRAILNRDIEQSTEPFTNTNDACFAGNPHAICHCAKCDKIRVQGALTPCP